MNKACIHRAEGISMNEQERIRKSVMRNRERDTRNTHTHVRDYYVVRCIFKVGMYF